MLESLIKNVPTEHAFVPLMTACSDLVHSKNPSERKGGFVVLAIVAENCSALLTDKLGPYLALICESISDSDRLVRAAACVALTQFADCAQPHVLHFHNVRHHVHRARSPSIATTTPTLLLFFSPCLCTFCVCAHPRLCTSASPALSFVGAVLLGSSFCRTFSPYWIAATMPGCKRNWRQPWAYSARTSAPISSCTLSR